MATAPAKVETDAPADPPVDTTESSAQAPTTSSEPAAYSAAVGDTVTDASGRIGLVVAADKDRGGAEIGEGEAAEPMVIWLPEAAAYGGELTKLGE